MFSTFECCHLNKILCPLSLLLTVIGHGFKIWYKNEIMHLFRKASYQIGTYPWFRSFRHAIFFIEEAIGLVYISCVGIEVYCPCAVGVFDSCASWLVVTRRSQPVAVCWNQPTNQSTNQQADTRSAQNKNLHTVWAVVADDFYYSIINKVLDDSVLPDVVMMFNHCILISVSFMNNHIRTIISCSARLNMSQHETRWFILAQIS